MDVLRSRCAKRSIVDGGRNSEVLIRDDGAVLVLFANDMAMRVMQRMNEELLLEPLVAEGGGQ